MPLGLLNWYCLTFHHFNTDCSHYLRQEHLKVSVYLMYNKRIFNFMSLLCLFVCVSQRVHIVHVKQEL